MTLLGRVAGSMRSVLLRVEGTRVTSARYVDEALSRVHHSSDGALWALGGTFAYRFWGFEQERFPLVRPTEGPTNWLDLGGAGEQVLVWGAGALLAFDGTAFVPFAPDLALDPVETVLAVEARADRLAALVVRDGFGAIAHLEDGRWAPISEDALLQGAPVDLRGFGEQEWVLDEMGAIYTQTRSRPPRVVPFARTAAAFTDPEGRARPFYDLVPARSGLLLASRGGFLLAPSGGEATFYLGQAPEARGRLARIDATAHTLALLEGAAWLQREGAFHPLDLTQF
ncbi:hypothetical protein EON77_17515 [bacterium]|nr:MAG: hypothetical protein EON77_17515 [bacterium]